MQIKCYTCKVDQKLVGCDVIIPSVKDVKTARKLLSENDCGFCHKKLS